MSGIRYFYNMTSQSQTFAVDADEIYPISRPILFSAPMVLAIREGRKTVTRRVMNPQPSAKTVEGPDFDGLFSETNDPVTRLFACPQGMAGDELWVKETWRTHVQWDNLSPNKIPIAGDSVVSPFIHYEADGKQNEIHGRIRPSIFLPRWACRLWLDVVSVCAERVQDITDEDAMREGIIKSKTAGGEDQYNDPSDGSWTPKSCDTARMAFRRLWNSINEKRGYSWESNPWVFRTEFKNR